MRQNTDSEYADDLAKFIGPQNDAMVIIDPSAASFKAEMMKRGIWYVDADDDVSDGIRIASMVLNQRMVVFAATRLPRLSRRCKPMPGTPRRRSAEKKSR